MKLNNNDFKGAIVVYKILECELLKHDTWIFIWSSLASNWSEIAKVLWKLEVSLEESEDIFLRATLNFSNSWGSVEIAQTVHGLTGCLHLILSKTAEIGFPKISFSLKLTIFLQ